MHMHSIVDPCIDAASGEAPALVFRIVLRGAVQLFWRNRRVRLDQDAWLVLDGREVVAQQADGERGVDLFCVGASPNERDRGLREAAATESMAWAFGAGLLFADNLRPIGSPTGQRLLALAAARAGERRSTSWATAEIADLVSVAANEEVELRARASRIACAKAETREELLRRILRAADFIASHHDEPISLDEMARAASLSRFHFGRLFSLVHGETPHAFLLRKRTAVALRHLAVGAACQDAAARAGFGSRSALFRSLRKTTRCNAASAALSESCFLSA
jgi:AraC-like DNA-binding protein